MCCLALVCGCSTENGAADQVVVRQTDGNITVVRNLSGSRWGAPAHLGREGFLIDAEENPFVFGQVLGLWMSGERIYVVDSAAPAVRAFDDEGRYLHQIGRAGDAEGEYRFPNGIAVGGAGRVYVRHGVGGQRINVYGPDGELREVWEGDRWLGTETPLVLTSSGQLYSQRLLDRAAPNDASRYGMVRLEREGVVGAPLRFPSFGYRPLRLEIAPRFRIRVPFDPRAVFAMSPSGALIAGVNHRYRFTIAHADGRVTVIERATDVVRLDPEEREWERRRTVGWNRRFDPRWEWDGAEIPLQKPAFAAILPDHSGRLWVVREGTSERLADCTEDVEGVDPDLVKPCWVAPTIVDVFEEQGDYLGEVQLSPGETLPSTTFIRGDSLLTTIPQEGGGQLVTLLRLVLPERSVAASRRSGL